MRGSASLEALLAQSAWLGRLAAQLVRDRADQEDAVQDTWAAALRSPPDPRRPPRPWLAQVLRNFVRMRARGARHTARSLDGETAAEAPLADATLERVELQRLVAELMTGLAEPYRTALVLRYFEDRTPGEIAAELNLPGGTVRWRLKEGLDQLRARLDERLGGRRAWLAALAPMARRRDLSWWTKGAVVTSKGKVLLTAVALGLTAAGVATTRRTSGAPTAFEVAAPASAPGTTRKGAPAPRREAQPGARRSWAPPKLVPDPAGRQALPDPAGGRAFVGPLDANSVVEVLRGRIQAIKGCYDRLDDGTAHGRINLRFVVHAQDGVGRVSEGDVAPVDPDAGVAELASPLVQQCVLNALAEARFPPPQGGDAEVQIPLDFSHDE